MAINQLALTYPDFKNLEIIDPEKFDINNKNIVDKLTEVITLLNQHDISKANAQDVANVAMGSYKLGYFTNTGTITSQSSVITVSIDEYNNNTDLMFVFINGILQQLGLDYSYNSNTKQITNLDGYWEGAIDTVYYSFIVLKNYRILNQDDLDAIVTVEENEALRVTAEQNRALAEQNRVDSFDDMLEEVAGIILDQIVDNSLTDAKLVNTAGSVKDLATKALPAIGGTIQDYDEKLTTNATATGTVSLDLSLGNVFDVTLTGITTFTFDNPSASGKAGSFTLILRQGGTAYAVTWPTSVKWASDAIPVISDINKTSIFSFVTVNGGTRWYGTAVTKLTT